MRLFDVPPSMLDPHGSEASHVSNVWWIMFGLAAAVYLVVGGFIVVASLRGRRREPIEGPSKHDQVFIWAGGVIVPTIILAFIAFLTVHTGAALRNPSKNPLRVHVVGEQWWWRVDYPGTNVATANEIYLPVGQPIEIRLETADVNHSFWVPQLAGKMDLIAGQPNTLRFTIDMAGVYRGQCAEFCGLQHAHMAFRIIAESPGDFARWMLHEQQISTLPLSDLASRGQVAFTSSACAGCHTVRGTPAQGTIGPDLTNIGERAGLGAETIVNTPSNLRKWIEDPGHFKPGAKMPPATNSGDDLDAIAAYLEGLK
jgi:cytochrome c oxidase subunit 2